LDKIVKQCDATEKQLADLCKKHEAALLEKSNLQRKPPWLIAADKLITGLGSEKEHWALELAELKAMRIRLLGDYLLGSAFLSYTCAFNSEFRRRMVQGDWLLDLQGRDLPVSNPFSLQELLTTDVEIAQWDRRACRETSCQYKTAS